MRRTFGVALYGIMLSQAVSLPAMAFDCAKASSRTEKLICATPSLLALDAAMSKSYGELKSSLPAEQQPWLLSSQRSWIKVRAGNCEFGDDGKPNADDGAVVACLEQKTEDRRAMLSGARADAPAAAPRLMPVFFHQVNGKDPDTKIPNSVDLSYPQAAPPGIGSLNTLLRQAAEGGQPWKGQSDVSYDAEYRIALQTESFISVVFSQITSISGGAHPDSEQVTVNFDLKAGREATLDTLLRPGAQAEVSKLCIAQLRKHYGADWDEGITKSVLDGEVGKIKNWTFEPGQILIEYNFASFAYHAMGDYACKLTGTTAAGLLRPEGAALLGTH
jgi:uncharacterized protein YecT (DUF1311 family)